MKEQSRDEIRRMYENLRKNRMQRSVDGLSYTEIRNQKDF